MDHHMFPGIGTCQVQCRCHHFDIPESKLLQVNKLMYGLAQIARVVSYIIIHTFIAEFSWKMWKTTTTSIKWVTCPVNTFTRLLAVHTKCIGSAVYIIGLGIIVSSLLYKSYFDCSHHQWIQQYSYRICLFHGHCIFLHYDTQGIHLHLQTNI